jgi:hypothetical protein
MVFSFHFQEAKFSLSEILMMIVEIAMSFVFAIITLKTTLNSILQNTLKYFQLFTLLDRVEGVLDVPLFISVVDESYFLIIFFSINI